MSYLERMTGRRTDRKGHVEIRVYKNVWVPEHRLVMEQFLERKLIKGESVLRKSTDPADNRLENLELYYFGKPAFTSLCEAQKIVSLYEKDFFKLRKMRDPFALSEEEEATATLPKQVTEVLEKAAVPPLGEAEPEAPKGEEPCSSSGLVSSPSS